MPRKEVHLQRLSLAACALLLAAASAPAQIRGAALISKPRPVLWTWGDELTEWSLDTLAPRVLIPHADLAAGCVADEGLLALSRSRLVLLKPPRFTEVVLERRTDFRDCLPFTLSGRRGVLIPHLHAQLRFYEFRWPYRYHELYSIYTPSKQGGLLAHDVDNDGAVDLFLGNYWVRNPGRLGLPWRLFAVNTYYDTPDSALARLALLRLPGRREADLVWAESEAAPARIAWLERPASVAGHWTPHLIEPALNHPRALLTTATPPAIYVGHDDGITLFRFEDGRFTASSVYPGPAVIALFPLPGRKLLAVSPDRPRIFTVPGYNQQGSAHEAGRQGFSILSPSRAGRP